MFDVETCPKEVDKTFVLGGHKPTERRCDVVFLWDSLYCVS